VLEHLGAISRELMEELSAEDEMFARIYESFRAFQQVVNPWTDISDRTILNLRPEA
jgi:TRAP-type mannitol/chloroaromatic compound transport system substrate-binding protein